MRILYSWTLEEATLRPLFGQGLIGGQPSEERQQQQVMRVFLLSAPSMWAGFFTQVHFPAGTPGWEFNPGHI